jgi:peptidoglycan/xylan/chitin deacetylase (PgdA/CDA1 family)
MNPERWSIVIECGEGALALVRTIDSARRQSHAAPILLAVSIRTSAPSILDAAAQRAGAIVVRGDGLAAAIDAAAATAGETGVLIVPTGYVLDRDAVAILAGALAESADLVCAAGVVTARSPDGLHSAIWTPGVSFSELVADPTSAPPVVAVRSGAWPHLHPTDASLEFAASYDVRLQLLAQRPSRMASQVVASVDVAQAYWQPFIDHPGYRGALESILDRHRAAMQAETEAVVIGRERAAASIRKEHRALAGRRPGDAAELDRLRGAIADARAWLNAYGFGDMDWGDLRRQDPISRDWGYERGAPVDRRYIDDFLIEHASDVKGLVLEVQENDFTRRFGGCRVTTSDVVDLDESNPRATVVADLRHAPGIASDRYDCVILTQTLHVIDDVSAVLLECRRILRAGGVLLATVPAASRVCLEYGADGDFWRMTPAGARRLFETVFGAADVDTVTYGNVQTNVAFLEGIAAEELGDAEFDRVDPYFPALTGVRARKTTTTQRRVRARGAARGLVLLYHRIESDADVHTLNVSPDHFTEQLMWLKSHCTVMPLEEMLGAAPEDLPDRAVALTFDDGYTDNLVMAAPAMERLGMPATFFLTTRWLDEPGEYWWDTLERVLLDTPSLPPSLDIHVAGQSVRLPVGSAEERRAAHDSLHPLLVRASLLERDQSIGALLDWSGARTLRRRPLQADQVRSLARTPGMDVGAHTINHLALTCQPDEVVREETENSRAALERVIGRPVTGFAYPYGAVDRRVAEAVRPRWRFGCGCVERTVSQSFDPALVPRVEVKDWAVDTFANRVNDALTPVAAGARTPKQG